MLIPSMNADLNAAQTSLSRRVNANSQPQEELLKLPGKLIKKGEC